MKEVMIVDDDEDIIKCQLRIVKGLGHKSLVARSGKEFLACVEKPGKAKPGLVLLDVMMARPDTKEILERVRKLGRGMKIVLVTVVRFSEEEVSLLKQRYGVVDYVNKPYDVEEMEAVITKHLEE